MLKGEENYAICLIKDFSLIPALNSINLDNQTINQQL